MRRSNKKTVIYAVLRPLGCDADLDISTFINEQRANAMSQNLLTMVRSYLHSALYCKHASCDFEENLSFNKFMIYCQRKT